MFGNKISALTVAKWFLNETNYMKNITDSEDLTNLKLQKLLYYAQGIYLAKYNKPLFKEKVLAWSHGPVVKEVYDQYKKFGSDGIQFEGEVLNISDNIQEFLKGIYNEFAQYTAWKLVDKTHDETPWKTTERNKEINCENLRSFFLSQNYNF